MFVYFATPILVGMYTFLLYAVAVAVLRTRARRKLEDATEVISKLKSHAIRTILVLLFLGCAHQI